MKINSNTSLRRKLFFLVAALIAVGIGVYNFIANPMTLSPLSRFGTALMASGVVVLAVYYGLWDERARG